MNPNGGRRPKYHNARLTPFRSFVGLDCRYLWSAPPGVEPEIIPYDTEADGKTLASGKIEWLLKQGMTPDRIVLIGTHRLERSFLRDDPTLASLRVEAVNDLGLASDPSILRYSTPHRFKGLEADVVLLCDVDWNPMSCTSRNLYVAASRAKNRLYVFQANRYAIGARSTRNSTQSTIVQD